jgi:hypothetical protein
MNRTASRALSITRPILQILTVANLVYAAGITLLLTSSFFRPDWPWVPLGLAVEGPDSTIPSALRTVMVLGLVGAGIVHTILRRLLAIVDTVRAGDPFVAENAQRLQSIAKRVVGLELLRLAVHLIYDTFASQGPTQVDLGGAFVYTSWLAVLLLFVLSGVFAQGTRLRSDLEGTV